MDQVERDQSRRWNVLLVQMVARGSRIKLMEGIIAAGKAGARMLDRSRGRAGECRDVGRGQGGFAFHVAEFQANFGVAIEREKNVTINPDAFLDCFRVFFAK